MGFLPLFFEGGKSSIAKRESGVTVRDRGECVVELCFKGVQVCVGSGAVLVGEVKNLAGRGRTATRALKKDHPEHE